MTERRIGVIGCGDVSVVHIDAIARIPGLELVGVADTDPAARSSATERTGVPGFASAQELIDAVGPDAVHVTTPHHQHIDASITALTAGVHVLQEKPLAHTLAEGQRLVEALADRDQGATKVGICFQNRYNRASQKLSALLRSGELGEVRGAWASVVWTRSADYYRARPWRGRWAESGGGLLINQAIHTLDLVQWLLGPVERTEGHVATRAFTELIEVEDTAELLLHHEGGATTTFYGTLTAPRDRPVEIDVDCENAAVELRGGLHGGLTVHWDDGRVDRFGERVTTSSGRSYWGVSHELLIRDFHESLEDPQPFWIGPEQAMGSLQILKDAYRATGVGAVAEAR